MHGLGTAGLAMLVTIALHGCGGGGGGGDGGNDPERRDDPVPQRWFESYTSSGELQACSTDDLKTWVDHDMHDYYIYADRAPNLRLSEYDDEVALLRALRVAPDSFSGISDTGTFDDRYEEGIVVAYGYRWSVYEGEVRFLRVDAGSPADLAGLARGDTLVALDGIAEADLTDDDYDRIFDVDEGEPVRFTVRRGDGEPFDLDIARAPYAFETVPLTQVITYASGRQVGYLAVSSFLEPTDARLDEEIAWLAERDVTELVLDLRYNGGGRSRVANRLAARIGGAAVAGELYATSSRNDRYAVFDDEERFRDVPTTLDLSRLVVLTTGRTASASENLTNSLRPFMDVTVIGQRTRGKNFSSQGLDYCGKTLSAMNAIIANSAGVSVAGGIAPDCVVEDTADFPIDDDRDALRAAGLAWLENGSCPTAIAADATTRRGGGRELPEDPAFAPISLAD